MAKRVAAQRRGMLYGMIAALFVAVIMTVLFFIQVSEVDKVKRIIASPQNPDQALTTERILVQSRDAITGLTNRGLLPSGGNISLVDGINAAEKRLDSYRSLVSKLAFVINGRSVEDLSGDALTSAVLDVQGSAERTRASAVDALQLAPAAGVAGVQRVERADELTNQDQTIDLLASHIQALAKDYQAKVGNIVTLQADNAAKVQQMQTEIDTNKQAYETVKADQQKQITGLQEQVTQAQDQTKTVRDEYEAARRAHNEDLVKGRDELQTKVNLINEQDRRIRELSNRIARAEARALEPDGKVISLAPGAETGYIDLGRVHSVFNGLTFEVFDPRELGKSPPVGKGFIRLTKVMEASSEFVITDQNKANPIVEGDIIVNAAFDIERPWHFAIVGKFDLNRDGAEDTDWIKSKIRSFGGLVENQPSVQTDYLVVGDDPMNWAPKFTGSPSPQQLAIVESLKKQQLAFGEATDMAQRLHIPVLTPNRFLALIGESGMN